MTFLRGLLCTNNRIEKLDLSNNKLSEFNFGVLKYHNKLKCLNLDDNLIEKFSSCDTIFPSLTILRCKSLFGHLAVTSSKKGHRIREALF